MEQNKLIVITSVLYNEVCYIEEWVNFHLKQGFDLVYVYIRYKETEDNNLFNDILDKYKKYENVKLFHHKWIRYGHFNDFINNYNKKHINDWISFLDIDEFLHSPIEDKNIKDIIYEYEEKNIYAVQINWSCFGSNKLIEKPEQVVGSYGKPANKYNGINYETKSLVKFNCIKEFTNTHYFNLKHGYTYYTSSGIVSSSHNKNNWDNLTKRYDKWIKTFMKLNKRNIYNIPNYVVYPDENPSLIINHYIIRSENEYFTKIKNNPNRKDRYNMTNFKIFNKVIDEVIDELL